MMKRIYTHTNNGNSFSIISQGLDNGLQDINGDPTQFETYEEYVSAGFIGNRKVFEYIKSGNVIEAVTNSPYIIINNGIPIWNADAAIQLLAGYNETIKNERQVRYATECDIITTELTRRQAIDDITSEEVSILVETLRQKGNLIKNELPYIAEVLLL